MELDNSSLVALYTIHSTGVITALASTVHFRFKRITNLTRSRRKYMMLTTIVVSIITLVLVFITPGIGSNLCEIMGKAPPPFLSNLVTFQRAVAVCAVMDLIGLLILISLTGGPLRSLYQPFLIIIVPLIMILGTYRTTILVCFSLTLVIFFLTLFWLQVKDFQARRRNVYNIYYAIMTGLCVFSPILLRLIAYNHT